MDVSLTCVPYVLLIHLSGNKAILGQVTCTRHRKHQLPMKHRLLKTSVHQLSTLHSPSRLSQFSQSTLPNCVVTRRSRRKKTRKNGGAAPLRSNFSFQGRLRLCAPDAKDFTAELARGSSQTLESQLRHTRAHPGIPSLPHLGSGSNMFQLHAFHCARMVGFLSTVPLSLPPNARKPLTKHSPRRCQSLKVVDSKQRKH